MRVGLALVVDLLIVSAVAHVAGPEAAACAALIIMRWEAGALGRDG